MKGTRQPAAVGEVETTATGDLSVPETWAEARSVNRALATLPRARRRDYREKLAARNTGIIAELQVMGRLLERAQPPEFLPYPKAPTVEGLLTVDAVQYELEIKSLLGTKWEIDREHVYREIAQALAHAFPDWRCHVRVADRGIVAQASDSRAIDTQRTVERFLTQFERETRGRSPSERIDANNTPDRLIVTIDPAAETYIYTGEQEREADHDLKTFTSKVESALARSARQFSKARPAIIALVCARDASAPLFLSDRYGIAESALNDHPHLSAILALPYLSFTASTTTLAWRDTVPASGAGIVPSDAAARRLLALFNMPGLGSHEQHVAEFKAAFAELRRGSRAKPS